MACAYPPDLPLDEGEEELAESGDSPDMVKRIRTTKLSSLSKLANRIGDHMQDAGSRKVLKVYRNQFCEQFNECVKLHSRYNLLAKPQGIELIQENTWLLKLDDKVNKVLRAIDRHLQSREGQTETCSSMSHVTNPADTNNRKETPRQETDKQVVDEREPLVNLRKSSAQPDQNQRGGKTTKQAATVDRIAARRRTRQNSPTRSMFNG